ncbi:hypothetical protein AQUCO_02800115v1 [Aquilegia coerulea]|uniref:Uncharacterized protein n=1 Tax=Aquilegia coerulea TaxID=218851 RepID=A0A2G5D3X3_AQUCA|nr:hypothetical protein AQUCO_02800115v1 [Aquilegia coerulea]
MDKSFISANIAKYLNKVANYCNRISLINLSRFMYDDPPSATDSLAFCFYSMAFIFISLPFFPSINFLTRLSTSSLFTLLSISMPKPQ